MAELRFKPRTPGFPFSLHQTILRWSDSCLPLYLILPVPEIPLTSTSQPLSSRVQLKYHSPGEAPPEHLDAVSPTSTPGTLYHLILSHLFCIHTHCLKLLISLFTYLFIFWLSFSIYHRTGGVWPILELHSSSLEQHCLGWSRQLVSVCWMNRRQVMSKENQTQQCVPCDSATFQSGGNSRPCFRYFWMMEHVFMCSFTSEILSFQFSESILGKGTLEPKTFRAPNCEVKNPFTSTRKYEPRGHKPHKRKPFYLPEVFAPHNTFHT